MTIGIDNRRPNPTEGRGTIRNIFPKPQETARRREKIGSKSSKGLENLGKTKQQLQADEIREFELKNLNRSRKIENKSPKPAHFSGKKHSDPIYKEYMKQQETEKGKKYQSDKLSPADRQYLKTKNFGGKKPHRKKERIKAVIG